MKINEQFHLYISVDLTRRIYYSQGLFPELSSNLKSS